MPRPPFALTDDQARVLTIRVAALQDTYPLNSRNHRPFVRGFLRAVREATGQLYSPAIYQRLLAAFAPERRPSTGTLAVEKQTLAAEDVIRPTLAAAGPTAKAPANVVDPGQLHAIVTDAIDAGLARAVRGGLGGAAQTDFYAARLARRNCSCRRYGPNPPIWRRSWPQPVRAPSSTRPRPSGPAPRSPAKPRSSRA